MLYLTSDTHFNHARIIEYCNRPFSSVQEMNEILIKNIQDVLKPEDTFIHLGDVSMGSKSEWINIVPRITLCANTNILVLGNHDIIEKGSKGLPNIERTMEIHKSLGWDVITDNYHFDYAGFSFWCAHIPMYNDDDKRGYKRPSALKAWDVALCGHIHEKYKISPFKDLNVGVDQWDMKPVSIDQIVNYAYEHNLVRDKSYADYT